MREELAKIRKEKNTLDQQIDHEQNEFVKLRQKYLDIERQLEKAQIPNDPAKTQETMSSDQIEELQMKLQDLEQSNKVLKRIKNAFKQTSEVKCRGCSK